MTAIEFLRRYRPEDLERAASRGEYQLKSHDSFKINGESSVWHWKSRDIGGKSALDYLIKVEGMKFVDAVRALCEVSPVYIPPVSVSKPPKEFVLPLANRDNRSDETRNQPEGNRGLHPGWDPVRERRIPQRCVRGVGTKMGLHGTLFCAVRLTWESRSNGRFPAAINGSALALLVQQAAAMLVLVGSEAKVGEYEQAITLVGTA